MDNKDKYYDLFSGGIILFIAVVQLARWGMLPQFIDDYFHLHQALGFIKAGGWSGIAFWDYAPFGRPNLYPPFYHILIAFLLKLGWEKIFVLKIINILISISFFTVVWYVLRKVFSSFFGFLNLLILFSTFSFYESVCANSPATLALIFVFVSFLFLKQQRLKKSLVFAALAFYTHAGISWAFFLSLLFASFYQRQYLKVATGAFLFYLPLLWHQLKYIGYFHQGILFENFFIHFNPTLLVLSLVGIMVAFKRRERYACLLLFSFSLFIVFFRYPFRILSAQGVVGLSLLSTLALEYLYGLIRERYRGVYTAFILIFFLFFNCSIVRHKDKFYFYPLYASLSQFISGNFSSFLEFRNIASSRYFRKVVKLIKRNTASSDIVGSNIPIASEILGALCNRSVSSSMLIEVSPFRRPNPLRANLIVWFRQLNQRATIFPQKEKELCRDVLYEDDISFVCRTDSPYKEKVIKTKFHFIYIYILLVSLLAFLAFSD